MTKRKHILAILVALMLSLGSIPAMAETPTTLPDLADLLGDIGTMRYDVKMTINPEAANLIPMLTGEMADEESGSIVSIIISAINKLNFSVLANKEAISAVIGSEAAQLMDIRAVMNQQTFENQITTSMLPGLAMSIDPEMIQKFMGQASKMQVDPEEVIQIVQLHLQTIGGVLGEAAAAFTPEEGTFIVEDYGTFNKRTQVTLTTHMLADVIQKLADIYNSATVHKEFMEKILSASKSLPEGTEAAEEIPDIGMVLEDAAKQGKAEPDIVLMTGWVYENEESTYIDGATAEGATGDGSMNPTKLDILLGDQGIKAKIISQGYSFTAEGEEPTAPDWNQIEKDILAGENYSDMLMTLNILSSSELQQMNTEIALGMFTSGMNIGLTIKAGSRLDTMESNVSLSLSMLMPDPILTVTVSAKPTDEQPAAPVLEGATTVVLKENGMTDEEGVLLQTSLTQAIPELLSRIGAALPEEGPALMQMLGELIAPPVDEMPLEEPQPDVIEESVEEPTIEVIEEPAPANP